MTHPGTLTPHWFSMTLRTKLVFCTAIILIIACLLLGWLFIQQQVRSTAESSVQSGTLLAQHLAHMGRSSIVEGDIPRLNQLIREILAVNPVAYVAVISPNGELQTGFGKGTWEDQFSQQTTGQRQFSATTLLLPRHRTGITSEPLVSAIDLKTEGPVLRQKLELTPGELMNLVGGAELPIFYDITVHVPPYALVPRWDPALQLTLEERLDGSEESMARTPPTPTLVQIGLSTSRLQQGLRRLLWQAVMITLSTLAGGLCIAVILARRITIPLQGLTLAATKLAGGETVPPLDIRTRDEIGTLTGVFNNMATRLHARERELRELAHTLEDRVKVRTEELAAANARLQEIDRRKSIFVSTASHELRTPLTSMKVHVANLRDGIDGAVSDEQRRSLARVEANLSRLQLLIDDLLDLSQIEMGQTALHVKPVTVGTVIAKAVEDVYPMASERRVNVVITLASDLPEVSADPDKFYQITLNLLHNAVKFTHSDTTVDVSAAPLSDGTVQISVSDAGPGIMLEDAEKIFQPFYRVSTTGKKSKGAGLGLSIAKLLVELHYGRLWVETVPGCGSRFSFTLHSIQTRRPAMAQAFPLISPYPHTIR
ncbi:MAG: putative Histidine kinase [Candidatus Nitrospira kreftii]|uniref:histidine kinase n=1 Tax=Candidatus Nitrospira kreftii TaxID=2652173 RepID=A0A7S8FDM8_9BACT|nr:MAG: putative Histidine kinase [Candidatus Nitrospira kreftii]